MFFPIEHSFVAEWGFFFLREKTAEKFNCPSLAIGARYRHLQCQPYQSVRETFPLTIVTSSGEENEVWVSGAQCSSRSCLRDDSCNNNCLALNACCHSPVTPLCSLSLLFSSSSSHSSSHSPHTDSLAGNQSFRGKPSLIFPTSEDSPSSVEDLSVCIVRPVMMSIWNNFERKAVGIRGFVGLCGRSRCSNRLAGCRVLAISCWSWTAFVLCDTVWPCSVQSSTESRFYKQYVSLQAWSKNWPVVYENYVLVLYEDSVLRKSWA